MKQKHRSEKINQPIGKQLARTVKQGLLHGFISAGLGAIIWLIRSKTPLEGAITFTYFWAICLGIYSIFGSKTKGMTKDRLYTPEEMAALADKDRPESAKWMDYLRTGIVFLVAIMLENIKYYVL